MDIDLLNIILVLAGTLFGGAGLKIIEHFLAKKKTDNDLQTEIRQELRDDVIRLRDAAWTKEKEADQWQEKYYGIFEAHVALQADYRSLKYAYEKEGREIPKGENPPDIIALVED